MWHRSTTPLYLIHSDVWQSHVLSPNGFKYYVIFIDDFSRFTWLYPMRHKSEVVRHFQIFKTMFENLLNSKIKIFQSDGGGEFDNYGMRDIFLQNGILFRKSCPDTPEQNGVAERKHRHLLELARIMLFEAKMPAIFWVDAVFTATYIINRLSTPNLNGATPFEKLFHHSLDYYSMRIFGCACFPNFNVNSSNKLSTRSTLCVFLGYAPEYKGYRCLDPLTGKIYINRNVCFHENHFPYSDLISSLEKSTLPLCPPINTVQLHEICPPSASPLPQPSHRPPAIRRSITPPSDHHHQPAYTPHHLFSHQPASTTTP
ncbi:unnamed protein product, partial [Cuscuta epithymum]